MEMYFAQVRYVDPLATYIIDGIFYSYYFHEYTGIVADLIDNDAETADKLAKIDNVSGFTIKQIETAFFNSKSMESLKTYLKENYPSGKDGRKYSNSSIDALFNYWINL